MSDNQPDIAKDDTQPVQATQRMERSKRPDRDEANGERQWPFGYLLLWLLAVISLLMNVIMMRQLLLARQAASQAIGETIALLDSVQEVAISYDVVVDQMLQIETDLPIDETIPVVIEDNLPINTTVRVSVNAGPLGQIPLNVPIEANVPVYIEQDLHIDQPFFITMAVPVNFTIPIHIALSDTPFYGTLDDVKLRLEDMQEGLNKPLIPMPGTPGD